MCASLFDSHSARPRPAADPTVPHAINVQCARGEILRELQLRARVYQQAEADGVAEECGLVGGRRPLLVRERRVRAADQQRLQRSFAAVLGGDAQHGRVVLAPARVC